MHYHLQALFSLGHEMSWTVEMLQPYFDAKEC